MSLLEHIISEHSKREPELSLRYQDLVEYHQHLCVVTRSILTNRGILGPWTTTEKDYQVIRGAAFSGDTIAVAVGDAEFPTESLVHQWWGIIKRNPQDFSLSAFLGLPPGHRSWGLTNIEYDELQLQYFSEDHDVIQTPEAPGRWWVGFHTTQGSPVMHKEATYWSEILVREKLYQLARTMFSGDWKQVTFGDMLKDL